MKRIVDSVTHSYVQMRLTNNVCISRTAFKKNTAIFFKTVCQIDLQYKRAVSNFPTPPHTHTLRESTSPHTHSCSQNIWFVNKIIPNICVYAIIVPSLSISDVLLLRLLSCFVEIILLSPSPSYLSSFFLPVRLSSPVQHHLQSNFQKTERERRIPLHLPIHK